MRKNLKKLISVIVFILVLVMIAPLSAYADIIIEKPEIEDVFREDYITVRAYKMATKLSDGVYQFTDAFFESGYSMADIWGSDSEQMSEMATGLKTYVMGEDIPYTQVKVPFGQDIVINAKAEGIYLIVTKELVSDTMICRFQPLICMVEEGEDLIVNPKYLIREMTPEEEEEFEEDSPWDGYWDEKLPQTGLQLMPLYIMGFIAVMCIITAWGLRNGDKFLKFLRWMMSIVAVALIGTIIVLWWKNDYEERQSVKAVQSIEEDIRDVWALKKQEYAESTSRDDEDDIGEAADNTQDNVTDTNTSDEDKYTVKVNNITYNGLIKIPSLNVELPVSDGCTLKTLKVSPGLYFGSVNDKNMVIGAHNWSSQFKNLYMLNVGSVVTYTDLNGVQYNYNVVAVTEVEPTMVEEVCTSGYELVLFTCTPGGARRVVVYCEKV